MSLTKLKKDAKKLYERGHLSQAGCCNILGIKEPDSLMKKTLVALAGKLASAAVHLSEPKGE